MDNDELDELRERQALLTRIRDLQEKIHWSTLNELRERVALLEQIEASEA